MTEVEQVSGADPSWWDERFAQTLRWGRELADRVMMVASSSDSAAARATVDEWHEFERVLGLLLQVAPDRQRLEEVLLELKVLLDAGEAAKVDPFPQIWAKMEVASGRRPTGPGVRVILPRSYVRAMSEGPSWQLINAGDAEQLNRLAKAATKHAKGPRRDLRVYRAAFFSWLRATRPMSPSAISECWHDVTTLWHNPSPSGGIVPAPLLRAAAVAQREWRDCGGDIENLSEERVKEILRSVRPLRGWVAGGKS